MSRCFPQGRKRKSANGYACDGKAEQMADFVVQMQGAMQAAHALKVREAPAGCEALRKHALAHDQLSTGYTVLRSEQQVAVGHMLYSLRVLQVTKSQLSCAGLAAAAGSGNKVHYIVLDHVERIAAADVLPLLLRLREMTGTKLGLVLISQVAWGLNVFEHDTLRCPKPHQLCFPGYRMQDLLSVHHLTRLPFCIMVIFIRRTTLWTGVHMPSLCWHAKAPCA